ncbi:BA14K family protein [Bradyrhizobium manausense]
MCVKPHFSATSLTCAQRYRSYDPATITFAAKDGRRYPCQ